MALFLAWAAFAVVVQIVIYGFIGWVIYRLVKKYL
jgi:hypothetical protein